MSRLLLILGIVLLLLWQWRNWRRKAGSAKPSAPPSAVEMIACAHCGTHVAVGDALSGRQGRYCCAEHRAAAER